MTETLDVKFARAVNGLEKIANFRHSSPIFVNAETKEIKQIAIDTLTELGLIKV